MRQRGFAYVWTLLLVALFAAASVIALESASTLSRRSHESDLLWVGTQFSNAIRDYYMDSQGKSERYPRNLEDLLESPGRIMPKRYLRRIYLDPLTGSSRWGLERSPGGGITAVYSLADGVPLKQQGFPSSYEKFVGARSYREWKFGFDPANIAGTATAPERQGPFGPAPLSPPAASQRPVIAK